MGLVTLLPNPSLEVSWRCCASYVLVLLLDEPRALCWKTPDVNKQILSVADVFSVSSTDTSEEI
jgi:hypothetical protein